jgi:hypothetical protein
MGFLTVFRYDPFYQVQSIFRAAALFLPQRRFDRIWKPDSPRITAINRFRLLKHFGGLPLGLFSCTGLHHLKETLPKAHWRILFGRASMATFRSTPRWPAQIAPEFVERGFREAVLLNQHDMPANHPCLKVFVRCTDAIRANKLIRRESRQDKEFHFQNWFKARLAETGLNFEAGGRNSYPDFRLVASTDGFEVKGLAYPGREANYDCNSQVPSGRHNGRTIFYLFGRYPAESDGDSYPVLDLVVCHGDFLNADHDYVHKNKSVKGFGSYGDIMIRDRKMYVAPTPFGLTTGTAHNHTVILPADFQVGSRFRAVGNLVRQESERLIVGYTFDLRTNELKLESVENPAAGKEHSFVAYRPRDASGEAVAMHSPREIVAEVEEAAQEDE